MPSSSPSPGALPGATPCPRSVGTASPSEGHARTLGLSTFSPFSPYRQTAPLADPLASRLPRLRDSRAPAGRPGLRAVALTGSLLAHAALLTASALTAPADASLVVESQSVFPFDPYLVRAEPLPFYCSFPPSESLAACFTRAQLLVAGQCVNTPYCPLHEQLYGHDADPRLTSTPIPFPFIDFGGDNELALDRVEAELLECAVAARENGWSGRGTVFIRVAYEAGGGAVAQTFPRDSDADNPALLCCLRHAQLGLASTMRPGTAVRYHFSFGAEGVVVTPLPTLPL